MKLARGRFIRLDDKYDREAAMEAGLSILQEKLGNYPNEVPTDVVVTQDRAMARIVIDALNSTACALRSKARRQQRPPVNIGAANRRFERMFSGTRRNDIPHL